MNELALPQVNAMSADAVAKVRRLENQLEQLPQADIQTEHFLHAGMYARTITIPAGVMLTGALIRVPTVLVIAGDADVFMGDRTERLAGYHVLQGCAGRKQAFLAHEDTQVTMIFPTDAATLADAEDEFTEEADRLMSRRQGAHPCQEQ